MKISEMIAELEDLKRVGGDVDVVVKTSDGKHLIAPPKPGLVRVIPSEHPHLKRGNSWCEPLNAKDKPRAERSWKAVIGW